jgi:hypothetical protein
MEEHEKLVGRVADWLADEWDWDRIGVALGIDGDEAYRRYGREAAALAEQEEHRHDQDAAGAGAQRAEPPAAPGG